MNRDKFSEVVGLNKATIIKYENDFKIPVPRDPQNGYRVYGEEEVKLFNLLKEELKTKSIAEIQRELKLKPDLFREQLDKKEEKINESEEEYKVYKDLIQTEMSENINDLKNSVSSLYENIQGLQQHVIQQTDNFKDLKQLSENLSMSMYKIGQLEEKIKNEQHLHALTIEKYESEKRLITEASTGYHNKLVNEIESLKQSNDSKDNIINELKKELDKEKSRTLFQYVFKKKA